MTTYKVTNPCWCGCGGTTQKRFVPGHDARFHSRAKRVARDQIDGAIELTKLPHAQAEAEFIRHIDLEIAKVEEKKNAALLNATV